MTTASINRHDTIGDDAAMPPQRVFRLELPSRVFILVWWIVLVLRGCETAFLLAVVGLYDWFLHAEHGLALLHIFDIRMSDVALIKMNWHIGSMAVGTVVLMLRNIINSIRARRIVFTLSTSEPPSSASDPTTPAWIRRVHRVWTIGTHAISFGVAHTISPFLSIYGKYFDAFFICKEFAEVASQASQAFQMAKLNGNRWINNVFVKLIVLNCFSTPLIWWLVPDEKVALRRMADVFTSAFLNFCNSVVIPLIIVMPYVRTYDPRIGYFPEKYTYDDVWFVKAVSENQQLLITSVPDFVITMIPYVSLLMTLWVCEKTVLRSPPKQAIRTVAVIPPSGVDHTGTAFSQPASSSFGCRQIQRSPPSALNRKCEVLLHNLLWMIGVAVLGIHLAAQSPGEVTGCKLVSTPWFASTTSLSCVVMNLNCHRRGINGSKGEIERVLLLLNGDTLSYLILSHCPRLEVPDSFRKFRNLNQFEIYNLTLIEWSKDNAISQHAQPAMYFFYLIRSNLTGGLLPDGLQDEDMPETLAELHFVQSNLSTLPVDLHEKWRNVAGLYLEYCAFTEFPATIYHMPHPENLLYLTADPIQVIDQDFFASEVWKFVDFSQTPLTSLPNQTNGTMERLQWLVLEYTQLEDVPEYIQLWFLARVQAGLDVTHSLLGSPYCSKSVQTRAQQDYQHQVCDRGPAPMSSSYPFSIMEPQRQW